MGVLLHSTAGATFPTKNVLNPLEGFAKDKKFCISKMPKFKLLFYIPSMLGLSETQHKLENAAACSLLHQLYVPPCPMKTQQCVNGWRIFSKSHFKQNSRTKCSPVSPPPVKNFTTLVASVQSENL